ncbi:anti-sigma factor antagonist [Amylibacter marinus]|uniref:Anti-sigma factor antagonist n=1 Tax=Amylibacter marinus TaxID=1475483 RepID=A0ABQ5VVM9_9RHOB|nr:STAS domain-containing protein [Amylibacter marinus]GLQ35286.1 anti-sigma factor antagonist [Amylibacter marinus]
MNFETTNHDGKLLVTLQESRLDAALAVRFKSALKELVDDGTEHMILDMSQVDFMDSSGLGAVVAHMKYMGADKTFEICGLTPTVDKVFKLTRMDSVFSIAVDAASALASDQDMAG